MVIPLVTAAGGTRMDNTAKATGTPKTSQPPTAADAVVAYGTEPTNFPNRNQATNHTMLQKALLRVKR